MAERVALGRLVGNDDLDLVSLKRRLVFRVANTDGEAGGAPLPAIRPSRGFAFA